MPLLFLKEIGKAFSAINHYIHFAFNFFVMWCFFALLPLMINITNETSICNVKSFFFLRIWSRLQPQLACLSSFHRKKNKTFIHQLRWSYWEKLPSILRTAEGHMTLGSVFPIQTSGLVNNIHLLYNNYNLGSYTKFTFPSNTNQLWRLSRVTYSKD